MPFSPFAALLITFIITPFSAIISMPPCRFYAECHAVERFRWLSAIIRYWHFLRLLLFTIYCCWFCRLLPRLYSVHACHCFSLCDTWRFSRCFFSAAFTVRLFFAARWCRFSAAPAFAMLLRFRYRRWWAALRSPALISYHHFPFHHWSFSYMALKLSFFFPDCLFHHFDVFLIFPLLHLLFFMLLRYCLPSLDYLFLMIIRCHWHWCCLHWYYTLFSLIFIGFHMSLRREAAISFHLIFYVYWFLSFHLFYDYLLHFWCCFTFHYHFFIFSLCRAACWCCAYMIIAAATSSCFQIH